MRELLSWRQKKREKLFEIIYAFTIKEIKRRAITVEGSKKKKKKKKEEEEEEEEEEVVVVVVVQNSYDMNVHRGRTPKDQEEETEDNFYDCQEMFEPPVQRRQEEEEKDEKGMERRMGQETESETAKGGRTEEEQFDRLMDSDSELKEDKSQGAEFDEEYLREVEKELTEEEKESRRQQSLAVKEKGNRHFKAAEWLDAEQSYTDALVSCPICFSHQRAILFSNRAAARLRLDLKDQALSDCCRAIDLNPDYVRALLRRAELYEQMEKMDEALEDYRKVLELDPDQTRARQACMRLPQQIQERNERLKEEMLGKLKDLGNMVLRPFGLSTNNFQVNQDADTGSYSINFIQSPNNNR
ncbi:hypothetical protein LDENG_00141490 [Lucifuga dentata]|nr:hypothetical protein LDENG_00141490 [Lucifuga dentata]